MNTLPLLISYRGTAPFSPADIVGLEAWYDASQLTGYSNNDPVTSWTDLSGNGFHATPGAFAQPTYQTGIKNGLPAIRFSAGSNQALRSFPTITTGFNPWTMFVVAHYITGYTHGERVLGSIYPTNANWLLGWWTNHINVAYYEGTIDLTGNAGNDTWKQYTGGADGATGYIWSSGVLLNSAGFYKSPNGGLAFSGYDGAGGSNELSDCEICEVIYYDGFLNSTDRGKVETYLIAKYAI